MKFEVDLRAFYDGINIVTRAVKDPYLVSKRVGISTTDGRVSIFGKSHYGSFLIDLPGTVIEPGETGIDVSRFLDAFRGVGSGPAVVELDGSFLRIHSNLSVDLPIPYSTFKDFRFEVPDTLSWTSGLVGANRLMYLIKDVLYQGVWLCRDFALVSSKNRYAVYRFERDVIDKPVVVPGFLLNWLDPTDAVQFATDGRRSWLKGQNFVLSSTTIEPSFGDNLSEEQLVALSRPPLVPIAFSCDAEALIANLRPLAILSKTNEFGNLGICRIRTENGQVRFISPTRYRGEFVVSPKVLAGEFNVCIVPEYLIDALSACTGLVTIQVDTNRLIIQDGGQTVHVVSLVYDVAFLTAQDILADDKERTENDKHVAA